MTIARAIAALPVVLMSGLLGTTGARAQDSTTVGLGVAAVPTYQGSGEYRVLPFPLLNINIGPFFAGMVDGVGMHVIDTPSFKIGGSVTYVRGYRHRDVPEGKDNLSDAAGARLFTTLRMAGFTATLGATRSIGGTKGTVADLRISYPMMVSPKLVVIPTVTTSWASDKHMNRYFGITQREANVSGLGQFSTSSGFKDVNAGITTNYRLADGLNLTANVGMSYLFDRAADSPLVQHRLRPMGFAGVSYSF